MMSTRAPACPPATLFEAAAQANGPVRLTARLRRGGASALLASVFLLPLAACAAQPAATSPAVQPAAQAPASTAARQQDGNSAAQGRQDAGTAAPASAPAAPPRPAAQTAAPAPSPATPSKTPVAERATTVGEVPTVATTTPTPTPGVATMPGAPAAIPGSPANPVTIPQPAPGPSTGSLLQTILALVLVLALLAGLAWAAKRYGPRVAGNSANLRMVGALNIGGRERIMVVEVGDQWIVVGASPGRVNALATMPKGDAVASAALAGHTPSASSFSDWLKQTIDKRNAK
jgi:flagellar biosynthetic protein FliO